MINEQDYNNQWTMPIVNPVTGKTCYGAAARNVRMSQYGGASGVFGAGFGMGYIHAFNTVQPMIDNLQGQLNEAQSVNQQAQLMNQKMAALIMHFQSQLPK